RTGLPIGPPSRQSDLIPRWSKQLGNWCWWEPSYQGLRTLARRTGVIATFQSEVVYEGDRFEYAYGDDDFIRHQPAPTCQGDLQFAYTITTFTNGARRTFTVMRRDEVEHVMHSSESWNQDWSPWRKHPAEQWKKTSSKRHCKTLELSEELAIASQAIDHGEIHRIDPMLAELFRRHQLALPESTAELIDLTQDERHRAFAQTPRARGSISMADLKPSDNGNRGHGNEGFDAASKAAKPAAPRQTAPPVEQPRKPEPGALISKQGLAQIRQATAAWNRNQQDRFLAEFGIDALEQLQASVYREAFDYIDAENAGGGRPASTSTPKNLTEDQIAELELAAGHEGLDDAWVRMTLPLWLGLGNRSIATAAATDWERCQQFIRIAGLCERTGSRLGVAVEHFGHSEPSEFTDAQLRVVEQNLVKKLQSVSDPFHGQ
ncbi:MAG: recombinase RecT, partial [Deltaproteobacteria bacterium]|nr:recombinase RecT [Deltaproteobacteria bacterium]